MMSRLIIVLTFAILSSVILFCKPLESVQEHLQTDKVILLDTSLTEIFRILPAIFDQQVYVFYDIYYNDGKGFYYKLFDYGNKPRMLKIFIDSALFSKRTWYIDFSISGNNLFLLDGKKILIFKLNGNSFYFSKLIELPRSCSNIVVADSMIICYNTNLTNQESNSKPNDSVSYIIQYNMNNGNLISRFFPRPSGLVWTFIRPRDLMDITGNKLILSSADKYNIVEYNFDSQVIGSITHILNTADTSAEQSNSPKNKGEVYSLMDHMKDQSLIRSVSYISDNKLMVCCTNPPDSGDMNNYSLSFDFWEKNDGYWKLTDEDLINSKISDNDNYQIDNEKIDRFDVSSGKILYLSKMPFFNDLTLGKTNKQVAEMRNEYNSSNGIRYSLIVKSFK